MSQMELFEETGQKKPEKLDEIEEMKAAYRKEREIHRLMGLLRFKSEPDGTYVARCAPDHDVLPDLAEYFTLRFGEMPWAIIDEKRGLCLCREDGGPAQIIALPPSFAPENHNEDPWEDLWRLYHKSINNEARNNKRLQQQFMPKRYQKYLPELKNDTL